MDATVSSNQVSEVKSIEMTHIHHFGPWGPWGGEGGWWVKKGVEMVKMLYLPTTAVVFRSETCLVLVRWYAYDNQIIIRPAIDHGGQ